jgi:putative SOS response-associated peptidase YedK
MHNLPVSGGSARNDYLGQRHAIVSTLDVAPFIRRNPGTGGIECIAATFGLIPFCSRYRSIGRKTENARSEPVAEKPAYRGAWRQRHFGIAPMAAFYEPSWESGKAVRWRIEAPASESMGAAAIWDRWKRPDGSEEVSFSLLTMNADSHPLMRRFHGPEDEKRMLVLLHPVHFADWLDATVQAAPAFVQAFPAELMAAQADPRPPRAAKTATTSAASAATPAEN